MATLNEGDEVIIPAPYWVSYPDIVLLTGATPVVIECSEEQGFKLTAKDLEATITNNTKWVILNSPSNPTGACYTEQEIRNLAHVLKRKPHVHILSDDIYEQISYEGFKFFTIAQIPELKNKGIQEVHFIDSTDNWLQKRLYEGFELTKIKFKELARMMYDADLKSLVK